MAEVELIVVNGKICRLTMYSYQDVYVNYNGRTSDRFETLEAALDYIEELKKG